jgi:hypothetical protein
MVKMKSGKLSLSNEDLSLTRETQNSDEFTERSFEVIFPPPSSPHHQPPLMSI